MGTMDALQVLFCVLVTAMIIVAFMLGKEKGKAEGFALGRNRAQRAAWFRQVSGDSEIDLTDARR